MDIEEKHPHQFYKYLNVAILIITSMTNSMIVQSLTIINHEITEYLPNVSKELVSLTALVFMILHPVVTIPVNYILDTYSLKVGISINCFMLILGTFLRMWILQSFYWVLVGNIVCALGNSFVQFCPAKFSATWFAQKKRLLITSILIFSAMVSGGFGALISPYVVHEGLPIEEGRKQLEKLVRYHFMIVGGVMIVNLLLFKADPWSKSPFSLKKRTILSSEEISAQPISDNKSKEPYIRTLKKIFTSKQFIFCFLTVGLSMSVLNSLITNIELYLKCYGMTSKDASFTSIVALLFGLINSVLASFFVRKNKKYKKVITLLLTATLATFCLFALSIIIGFRTLYWICVSLFGMVAIPILPFLVEYTCESMYPMGQASITGILIAGQGLITFFLGLASSALLAEETKTGFFLVTGLNILFFLLALFSFVMTKQQLLRMEAQKKMIQEEAEKTNDQQNLKQSMISEDQPGERLEE